jgi:hypothetical protein
VLGHVFVILFCSSEEGKMFQKERKGNEIYIVSNVLKTSLIGMINV